VRTLLLWCPDWPVIAAGIIEGIPVREPVVVLYANRVLACSPAARLDGVRRGLRKREAQGRCPQLVVVEHDPGRDARAFEPVVAAVEELAPGVEIVRSGACALAARGPASYYGSEEAAAERLVEQVAVACGVEAQAGVADGVFAALLAARAGAIVPSGQTRSFLSGLDVTALDRPDLADLLRRLGVRTLGDFAALPAADVTARFGFDGAYAHRLASGLDERPLAVRQPPPDVTVTEAYDPPLDRIDMAAFAARALAERLHQRLAGYGLAATRLVIVARTESGEELQRVWRHDGLLDAAAIADRVRWQLDGWLTGARSGRPGAPPRPTAGIDRLQLVPDGVVRHAGMQSGLWGELGPADERAHRALVRVQALIGPEAVVTAVLGGGRSHSDQVNLVTWGDERTPRHPVQPPWPGQLPGPAPASVLARPLPLRVCTGDGASLGVDDRLNLSGAPASVVFAASPGVRPAASTRDRSVSTRDRVASTRDGRAGERSVVVTSWAGPWPVDERWWAPAEASRAVRFQLCLADGTAILAVLRDGGWSAEAIYD
jgi:protein ImuB